MKMKKLACFATVATAVGLGVFFAMKQSVPSTSDAAKSPSSIASAQSAQTAVAASASGALVPFDVPSNQTATVRGTKPYHLVSALPIEQSGRRAVEAMGARTLGFVSRNEMLVEASPATCARLRADGRFTSVVEVLPSEKVASRLAALLKGGAEAVDVGVLTLAAEDRPAVIGRITASGGEILTGCLNDGDTFRARLSAAQVAALAACGDVRWLEKFDRPQLMNDEAAKAETMNVAAVWKSEELPGGLSGEGQIITTSDTGVDLTHDDLMNQVIGSDIADKGKCTPTDVNGHGTHTAGSIVGDGTASEGQIRGMAWGAKLWAWFCGGKDGQVYTPETAAKLFQPDPEKFRAYIHSASWGSNVAGDYTTESRKYDEFVWKNPDFLPVFSAGNEGYDRKTGRTVVQSIGSPATAKNVLSVGATQNLRPGSEAPEGTSWWQTGDPEMTAEYSSRGPCQDGRIKPDVVAPGSAVISTASSEAEYSYGVYPEFDGKYAYDFGTSMACPLTAGAVALVREWLIKQKGFTEEEPPTAALMKAVITGGAKGANVPGNDQGWGRADLAETLFPSNRAVQLVDRLPFAEGETFNWIVETTNDAPFDVQLVWVDYPGVAVGNQENARLVNDLDLTVVPLTEDGEEDVLYGNGGNEPDALNNVESVRIASAAARKYRISVNCRHIPYDFEEGGAAALYIRGAFDPAMTESDLVRVRIRETGVGYHFLDQALAAAQEGETVELVAPAKLRKSVTRTTAGLVMATNAVASASAVECADGASVVITNGVTFFSNVVFKAGSSAPVKARAPGKVKVACTAAFGVIGDPVPGIEVDDKSCFVLGGRLESGFALLCDGADADGFKFGTYDCAEATAVESAGRLVCAADLALAGVADGAGGLRWSAEAPVDPLTAVAYVDGLGAGGNAYYRELDRLFDDFPQGTNVVVVRPGGVLRRSRVFDRDYSISTTGNVVAVKVEADLAFRVTSGTLTVSGLTFEDFKGVGLLLAEGPAAALSVVNTTFRNIEGVTNHSGAVAALAGANLRVDGGLFDGCRATGKFAANRNAVKSYGGAMTVRGGGSVELIATNAPLTIVNGEASTAGGGVYVEGVTDHACAVSVAGELTVRDNVRRATGVPVADDMYLCGNVPLTCDGDLTAGPRTIGLSQFAAKGGQDPCVKGDVFARFDAASLTAPVETGKAFFHDADGTLFARVGGEGDPMAFVWDDVPDYRVPTKELAVCEVTGCSDVANGYYAAFADAVKAIDGDATLTLFKNVDFGVPLTVGYRVTILSDASLPVPCCVTRTEDESIDVTGSLTLANVTFDGGDVNDGGRLFTVCGGTMTLQSGATVCNVRGGRTRASGAIAVNGGGTFEMESGAEIFGCVNNYEDVGTLSGYGGALLVEDGSTALLRGGAIRGCQAHSAGGVFIGTRSTVRLSGDIQIVGNASLGGAPSNLSVSDDSTLILTGDAPFAGAAGVTTAYQADTNVFGRVENLSGDVQAAAHAFTNDVTRDVGMAVVSGSKTLLVWSSALNEEGQYVDADGNEYELVDGAPVELDEPQVETGLVYDGTEKVGLKAGVGYSCASGCVGTNVGPYVATASIRAGFVWKSTGGTGDWTGNWEIGKGTLTITDYVTFTNATYVCDEQPKRLDIAGELPAGVTVTYSPNNGTVWRVGEYEIVATFTCDNANYELAPSSLTATLTIVSGPTPPDPPPGPTPEIVDPDPVAFTSIEKVGDEWVLVATNAKQWCEYSLWGGTTLKTNEWTTPVVDWTKRIEPDGPITNRVTVSDDGQRFWILKARSGEKPVE